MQISTINMPIQGGKKKRKFHHHHRHRLLVYWEKNPIIMMRNWERQEEGNLIFFSLQFTTQQMQKERVHHHSGSEFFLLQVHSSFSLPHHPFIHSFISWPPYLSFRLTEKLWILSIHPSTEWMNEWMVGWVFLVNLFLFLLFLFILKIIIISNSSLVTGLIVYDLWFLWIDTWPIDIIDYFIYHFFPVRRIKVLKILFVNKYKSTDFNDFFSTNNRSIDRLIGWIVIPYVKKSFPLIKSLLEKKIASLTFFFQQIVLDHGQI